MTDKEKVARLDRKIKREQRKAHPDKWKINYLFDEIREIKGDGWVMGEGHYHGGPNKLDLYKKEKQKPRPPHDRGDHKRIGDFVEKAGTGELSGEEAVEVLEQCARAILWARRGHGKKTQALRLGIIAGVPVAELAREFKRTKPKRLPKATVLPKSKAISHQAIYQQMKDFRSKMEGRPLVTAACAAHAAFWLF
jgi:hypothetical protein